MSNGDSGATIEDWYSEDRHFRALPGLRRQRPWCRIPSIYDRAAADPEAFWADAARELLTWDTDFPTTARVEPARRQVVRRRTAERLVQLPRPSRRGRARRPGGASTGRASRATPGPSPTPTCSTRCRASPTCLKSLGVEVGDRVCIYMPMIPEAVVAMLACTRIGAAHTVVFGGFSPDSLIDRINDAEAVVVVTADGGYRRGQPFLAQAERRRRGRRLPDRAQRRGRRPVRRRRRHDLRPRPLVGRRRSARPVPTALRCPVDSEHLLYLLYTSGTTAKPKGIMHTTGGYLTQVAWTHKVRVRPEARDRRLLVRRGHRLGHRPQLHRLRPARQRRHVRDVRGHARHPARELRQSDDPASWSKDRIWDIIERYGVTQLYTAPTAIRTFMKWGASELDGHDLSSLRVLGTVGEPINPEAWMWYHEHIGEQYAARSSTRGGRPRPAHT